MSDVERDNEMESVARDIAYIADDIGSAAKYADGAYTLADLKRFQRRLVKLRQDMDGLYDLDAQRRGPWSE